jgi:hypothetical protein
MFSSGDSIGSRGVHHQHATLGCCLDVYVVYTNACPADHAQTGCSLKSFPPDLRTTTYHNSVVVRDHIQQFLGLYLLTNLHLEVLDLLKNLHSLLTQTVANENPHRSLLLSLIWCTC